MNSKIRSPRFWGKLGILLLLVSLVLSACGTSATQTAGATQPSGEGQLPVTGTTSTSAQERVGTLRVAAFPIAQTDPAKISSDAEVLIANHVYDYLVDVDADNQVQPRLASEWTRSDDGLSYTFTLVENATFHDGSPFTAADVVWTYNRLRNSDSGFPTVDIYNDITDIQADDDYHVTFRLSETNPFFLYDLSDNHALMMKAGTQDPTDFNGTGPFVVTDYQPENRMTLKANENYFVDGQPHLAGLEIIFFNDQSAAVAALRGGQIDLTMDLSTPQYQSLSDVPDLNAYDIPTNQFAAVRLRTDQSPGDDPRVMQALKLATDRDEIFQLVQQGYGAVGRDSPIGPVYDKYYSEETQIPARDPEAARQLLADAGYPDGLDMELNLLDTQNFPDLAVVLKDQWADAGINVEVVTLPESVYYGEGKWLDVKLGITGWGHRPYPQFYLDVMLTCGAKWNETRFCDDQFDQLAQTAGSSLDEQERIDAYHQIQKILIERGPMIVPYFFSQFGVISNRFEGFELKPFEGRTDFRTIKLAQ